MSTTANHPAAPALTGAKSVSPLRELFDVAWPTVLTMTSFTMMQFVDSWMVSRIGPVAFAAQGNGGIFSFTPISFMLGALSVVNTYVSQNLGAGHPRETPRYAWNAMWLAALMWLALIPYAFALPFVFERMGHAPEVVRLETQYAQILTFGCVLTLASRSLSHFFYGLHRPKTVFVATVTGNLTNVAGNWLLIYGNWSFPEWGVAGAAVATVFGTFVELLIPVCVFLGPEFNRLYGTRRAWRFESRTVREIFRIGWPKSLTFGNEMVCWSIFMSYLVGLFGEEHLTAGWIALRYMHLSFMPSVGISVAVTAVVGRYIGAGLPDVANRRAWLGVRLAVAYMGLCALGFVLFREPLTRVFIRTDDPGEAERIVDIASRLLICAAVFQVFDAMAITISGALSGAGDTVWTGVFTMVASWLFIVAGGWLMVEYVPKLESLGPWLGAATYIIILGLAFTLRWTSGKWREIRLVERDPLCGECGYNLKGLGAADPCPECGTPRTVVADAARAAVLGEPGVEPAASPS